MNLIEQDRQAKEIINNNGLCPKDILCSSCICWNMLRKIGCNPEKALQFVKNKEYIIS